MPLSIAALALCLTACGTRSVDRSPGALAERPKPVVSAALLSGAQGKTEIPRGATLETQWALWAEDRGRLDACVMLADAKTDVIKALGDD